MEAAASLATGSITAVSERALRAGADLLLLTGQGSFAPVSQHLLAIARDVRRASGCACASRPRGCSRCSASSDTPAP